MVNKVGRKATKINIVRYDQETASGTKRMALGISRGIR